MKKHLRTLHVALKGRYYFTLLWIEAWFHGLHLNLIHDGQNVLRGILYATRQGGLLIDDSVSLDSPQTPIPAGRLLGMDFKKNFLGPFEGSIPKRIRLNYFIR